MRLLLWTIAALIACRKADDSEVLAPISVAPIAPAPVDASVRVVVADAAVPSTPLPTKASNLSVWGRDVLCLDGTSAQCLRFETTATTRFKSTPVSPDQMKLELQGPCTWQDDRLVCGSTTTPDVKAVFGREEHFLFGPTLLDWFVGEGCRACGTAQPDALPKRQAMRAFPGGATQLSLGFRVGCVLAGDRSVWCWSDPATPKRMATPANVVEIAVQDPFTLCVRTDAGAVSCTPPYVLAQRFACSSSTRVCGEADVEQSNIERPFDPLVALSRPLAPIALPEPARQLVREDSLLYVIVMDSMKLDPSDKFGACTLGKAGAVTCWTPCEKRWNVFRVTGLPAISELSPDQSRGHALGADGTIWTWGATCSAKTVAAQKLALPPVAQLAPALHVRTGPQHWTTTRCARLSSNDVRCWTIDRLGALQPVFDPLKP